MQKSITIKNARLHNLKNLDVTLPKDKFIVATGVSGSGKSTLVFDILFEEGRKQYLQSIGVLPGFEDEEKFDSISGLGPTIAVKQGIIRQSNPRSTVGSKTRILNLLGVLFAADGQIYCSECDLPVDENLTCNQCGYTEERLATTYFSHNHPDGMCHKCSGRGHYYELDLDKLIPHETSNLIEIFESAGMTPGYRNLMQRNFSEYLDQPFHNLPDAIKHELIHGHFVGSNAAKRSYSLTRIFEDRIHKFGEDPDGFFVQVECSQCLGFRVGKEARHVRLKGKHIGDLGKMPLADLAVFLKELPETQNFSTFSRNLLADINHKISSLISARLGYLSLYREMPTLSGGEIQRLFLNSHLESHMDSLIYILDEPTAGLHETEKKDLLSALLRLRDNGNTVITVEHDRRVISAADHVIDLGPGAGVEGGKLIWQGSFQDLLDCTESFTGAYLSGRTPMPVREKLPVSSGIPSLKVKNATTNNLRNISISIPLGRLVGVAGVSGSGKSSLISKTLVPALKSLQAMEQTTHDGGKEHNQNRPVLPLSAKNIMGADSISSFVEVSQAPIGRNMNSTPVSYTGIWERIRKLFASQDLARQANLSSGHFSFSAKGACPDCSGSGREKIWLGGNMNIFHTCKSCKGKRFNVETLAVHYQGKNIDDILAMSVFSALDFFGDQPAIRTTLEILQRFGMGYIKLGQPTPTLSGGEAQRIKLAKEISKRRRGNILYILDEPTTGLSMYDTAKLIHLLDELVVAGNSVIVIEHDIDVLSCCDWLIELGPGAGSEGGKIIAQGTPEDLCTNRESITGRYLK